MLYILNCTMLCINYISVKLRCGRNRNIDKSNHAINLIKTLCCCCCWVLSIVSDSVRPQRRQPTRLSHPWDSPGKNTGVGCHFLLQCMKGKSESEVTQSYPTLSDPMDCSPPDSSIHGIFQARVLEWVAIAFSILIPSMYLIFCIRCWKRKTHQTVSPCKELSG